MFLREIEGVNGIDILTPKTTLTGLEELLSGCFLGKELVSIQNNGRIFAVTHDDQFGIW